MKNKAEKFKVIVNLQHYKMVFYCHIYKEILKLGVGINFSKNEKIVQL